MVATIDIGCLERALAVAPAQLLRADLLLSGGLMRRASSSGSRNTSSSSK